MLKQYRSLSRTVHLLCVGALVNRAGAFLVPFLTLYLRESLDLGIGFATTAMGVFGAGALVASLVGGQLGLVAAVTFGVQRHRLVKPAE